MLLRRGRSARRADASSGNLAPCRRAEPNAIVGTVFARVDTHVVAPSGDGIHAAVARVLELVSPVTRLRLGGFDEGKRRDEELAGARTPMSRRRSKLGWTRWGLVPAGPRML